MNETLDLNAIRSEIDARGLKVKYLAMKIGVIPGTLSSFLTGKRNLGPSAKRLLLLELNLTEEALKKKAA